MKKEMERQELLTNKELIYLNSLVETLKLYNKTISLKPYQDNSLCLRKKNGYWEIYIIEFNYRIYKVVFDNIEEACNKVLLLLTNEEALEIFNENLNKEHKLEDIYSFQNKYNLTKVLKKPQQ